MSEDSDGCMGGFMVSRQPVFDRGIQPWGTAISFVQPENDDALFSDETTASVLLEAHLPQRGPGHPTIVAFPDQAVLDGIPRALWPQGITVEVNEQACFLPGIVSVAAALKQAGYALAVADFSNQPDCRPLSSLADLIVISAADNQQGDSLEEMISAAHSYGAKVLVRGLKSWASMLHARTASADLLQGFFFNRMNLRPSGKSLTATQVSRLRLLECLGKPDADFKALAQVVEADAALTYRLLLFLNSASFGLARQVTSIQQAIVLAGWQPLRKWLEVALLTDLSPSARHQELCYYAAQRAGFLKRVARAAGMERLVPRLSLLGLLSYLEPIFEMPPHQVLSNVPIEDSIRLALCGEKSSLSSWLSLALTMENAEWDHAARLAKSAGLALADLSRCQLEAFAEADTLFRLLPAPTAAISRGASNPPQAQA
ncbi:MAG: EAL and HDOD domain-containing protein [Desulfovibrio sp.]